MSWAMRRRFLYLLGVILFFSAVVGGPIAYKLFTIAPTCFDGIQNQGETSVDRGGPCQLLDANSLAPSAVLWARALKVRDGSYNAVAYVQNPNTNAGVARVHYQFRLFDAQNILVADRTGNTYVMPGGITPVFESAIPTGTRVVTRAFFDFTEPPLWQRATSTSGIVTIFNKDAQNETGAPRVNADAQNTGLGPLLNVEFVATIFDAAGNAFASSATIVDRMAAGETTHLTFTWPTPFPTHAGRIDIIPLLPVQAQ